MVDARFKKGQIPWNKGKKGIYSEESLKKMSESHKEQKTLASRRTNKNKRIS